MKCIVDRLEGEYAVVEYNGKVLNLPRVFLPMEAHEGDILDVVILLDAGETDRLKSEIEVLMDEVWEK